MMIYNKKITYKITNNYIIKLWTLFTYIFIIIITLLFLFIIKKNTYVSLSIRQK